MADEGTGQTFECPSRIWITSLTLWMDGLDFILVTGNQLFGSYSNPVQWLRDTVRWHWACCSVPYELGSVSITLPHQRRNWKESGKFVDEFNYFRPTPVNMSTPPCSRLWESNNFFRLYFLQNLWDKYTTQGFRIKAGKGRDHISVSRKHRRRESKVDNGDKRSCPRVSMRCILIVHVRPGHEGRRITTSKLARKKMPERELPIRIATTSSQVRGTWRISI